MFQSPFSFEGRIPRLEYGISVSIVYACSTFLNTIITTGNGSHLDGAEILFIIYLPLLWFLFAQSAKREHDLGFSGWWQLIPFRHFWLVFMKGQIGSNKYGNDPKGDR